MAAFTTRAYYCGLLTPPDTPLFRSLDHDDPQPVNLAPRGRLRSQPISISRSVTSKSHVAGHNSASPHRLSPSPRSSGISAQLRGRSSSAPQSSPPRVFRSATPSRRPSPPPNKISPPPNKISPPPNKLCTATPRSSTPTLRRASTGSSIQAATIGERGASPVKTVRGNSSSPKLRGWQMTLPGFTSYAPPNLRTSLSDRPESHTRGSSPASRNGRELSAKFGRKSMSPTSSWSISTSHSQERDRFSSYSKGSLVSSGDDDIDSVLSVTVGFRSPPSRKDGALASNKAMSFSKKPSRTSLSNSVPRRTSDSAFRLLDQHKTPQNMFRPLLSSVPATTFRPIFSRNSSLTTSSNASSDQGVMNFGPDIEVRENEHNDPPTRWERNEDSNTHEEVFMFDKVDETSEGTSHEIISGKPVNPDDNISRNFTQRFDLEAIRDPTTILGNNTSLSARFDSAEIGGSHCDVEEFKLMGVCSKCGNTFPVVDRNENGGICEECAEKDGLSMSGIHSTIDYLAQNRFVSELTGLSDGKVIICQNVRDMEPETDFLLKTSSLTSSDQKDLQLSDQSLITKHIENLFPDGCDDKPQKSRHTSNPSVKVDVPEVTGISVLLQRSSSSKWPVLQGRTLSATNLFFEPSYARDGANTLRRSIGRDNASASSSTDLGSSKQVESYVQRQLSWKSEVETIRNDIDSNAQVGSMDINVPINSYETVHFKSEFDEKLSSSIGCVECDIVQEMMPDNEVPIISEQGNCEHGFSCMVISANHYENVNFSHSSATQNVYDEDCFSPVQVDEKALHIENYVQSIGGQANISGCSKFEEDYIMMNRTFESDILNAATSSPTIVANESLDELEDSQTDRLSHHNPDYAKNSDGDSIPQTSDGLTTSITEPNNHDELAIMVEGPRGNMSRSLTLDEATDTILFCSSIIHDLAYKAATIAMEDELEPLPDAQASLPTLTSIVKPIPDLREPKKTPNKPTPRSQMFKRKRLESQIKSAAPKEVENHTNDRESTFPNTQITKKADGDKPPKLESKCNCTVM
ncbi:hypothetical protein AXF42_Ash006694 [Apostasia shenzhenica]|uniref:Proline-rich family protein n=1 Tax=Apostasia shenzhenica TaxID=1088818 RepID=A0A2I0AIU7_9ASPA|nr:hypothetical protein AXF42_Ash006694 [Apostasia shenzhenica]